MSRVLAGLRTHVFSVHAPWNNLHNIIDLKLDRFISFDEFKGVIRDVVKEAWCCFS